MVGIIYLFVSCDGQKHKWLPDEGRRYVHRACQSQLLKIINQIKRQLYISSFFRPCMIPSRMCYGHLQLFLRRQCAWSCMHPVTTPTVRQCHSGRNSFHRSSGRSDVRVPASPISGHPFVVGAVGIWWIIRCTLPKATRCNCVCILLPIINEQGSTFWWRDRASNKGVHAWHEASAPIRIWIGATMDLLTKKWH